MRCEIRTLNSVLFLRVHEICKVIHDFFSGIQLSGAFTGVLLHFTNPIIAKNDKHSTKQADIL